jgi:hypothetical protein
MQNLNIEIRNPKQFQNPKFQWAKRRLLWFWVFFFGDSNLFRISSFEFRISLVGGPTSLILPRKAAEMQREN